MHITGVYVNVFRYRDMRVLMGMQVASLWQSLGQHREHFIPTMIGPFLQLTLVPEEDVRKATLPIIGDMMEYDHKHNGNFAQVSYGGKIYSKIRNKVRFYDQLLSVVVFSCP